MHATFATEIWIMGKSVAVSVPSHTLQCGVCTAAAPHSQVKFTPKINHRHKSECLEVKHQSVLSSLTMSGMHVQCSTAHVQKCTAGPGLNLSPQSRIMGPGGEV